MIHENHEGRWLSSFLSSSSPGLQHHKNCAEVYKSGDRISGDYAIDPDGLGAFDVFCDQTKNNNNKLYLHDYKYIQYCKSVKLN